MESFNSKRIESDGVAKESWNKLGVYGEIGEK